MAYDVSLLLEMSSSELDELFAQSPAGPIPNGDAQGTALVSTGAPLAPDIAAFVKDFAWQGKSVDAARGTLRNRLGVFGLRAVVAQVYRGESLLDQKPCIVLDYSKTSIVARSLRDEIRLIAPDTYLGRVYIDEKPTIHFALQFNGGEHSLALRWRRRFLTLLALALGIPLLIVLALALRFLPDRPVTYTKIEDHFKYGSTGGERNAGLPYRVWKVLPSVFKDKLPRNGRPGYEAFGMVYEDDEHGHRRLLPVGWQMRRNLGIDRVFVNCAICHHATVRLAPEQRKPSVYVGAGATNLDLGAFEQFLFACVSDERFSPDRIIPAVEADGGRLGPLDHYVVYPLAIWLMRERVMMLRHRFLPFHPEEWGPGRVDTWNSAKAGLYFPLEVLAASGNPVDELYGAADFPSIWNQEKRKHRSDNKPMELHWTGNNDSVDERNLSAAFGTGVTPFTADHDAIGRIQDWLLQAKPPAYPFPIDKAKAGRGAVAYKERCAHCHGVSGDDFSGADVGFVTDIQTIGTDRSHYDSYTADLAVNQGVLYAETPYRFTHFHKTKGYANLPLDGIWLRGPYLHNGSVPNLRALLEPAAQRPKTFCRGNDLFDAVNVGFVSTPKDARHCNHPWEYFYDTSKVTQNNVGHEYAAGLSPEQKGEILEYLKTF
jgi:processive rubber oxygenase RoxA-like protein